MYPDRCEGKLYDLNGNKFLIDILERPYLQNLPNVSAIPAGHYRYEHHDGPKLKDVWGCVNPPPGRTGICMHSATWVRQLEGCQAAGDSFGDVINEDGVAEYGIYHSVIALGFLKIYVGRDDTGKLNPFNLTIERTEFLG